MFKKLKAQIAKEKQMSKEGYKKGNLTKLYKHKKKLLKYAKSRKPGKLKERAEDILGFNI